MKVKIIVTENCQLWNMERVYSGAHRAEISYDKWLKYHRIMKEFNDMQRWIEEISKSEAR